MTADHSFDSLAVASEVKDSSSPQSDSESKNNSSSNGPILYCAPTGKAASVIKKRVGKKAFTIHQGQAGYLLGLLIVLNHHKIILLFETWYLSIYFFMERSYN